MEKPSNVKWSEWEAPEVINNRHQAVIHLASLGHSTNEIVTKTGYTPHHVRKLLRTSIIKSKVEEAKCENLLTARDRIKALADLAVETLERLLDDPSVRPGIKLAVSKFILNHSIGKPRGRTDNKPNLLLDILRMLDGCAPGSVEAQCEVGRIIKKDQNVSKTGLYKEKEGVKT